MFFFFFSLIAFLQKMRKPNTAETGLKMRSFFLESEGTLSVYIVRGEGQAVQKNKEIG